MVNFIANLLNKIFNRPYNILLYQFLIYIHLCYFIIHFGFANISTIIILLHVNLCMYVEMTLGYVQRDRIVIYTYYYSKL